jgi:hypothetical protein
MDFRKGDPGSSNKTCVTSVVGGNEEIDIEAEIVANMTKEEEDDQQPRTIPIIKTETKVGGMPVVSVTHISCRLHPEFSTPLLVCPFGGELLY